MTFAYLMNAYPMTSTTFIRREIEAHERAGLTVDRFAVRPWDTELVDPLDIAEADRVTYLLGKGAPKLAAALLAEAMTNPVGTARALAATWQLWRKATTERWKNPVYLLEAAALKRDAKKRGIDHIHTHFSTNSAAVAMLSQRFGGPSYSVTVHGPDELYVLEENAVELKLRHAAFFSAITEYARGVLDAHTGGRMSDKIRIVGCGLDMVDFPAPGPVPDNQALVCVGRLCAAKAQTLLVEAIAMVALDHPGVRLVLIGDGDTRGEIERLIRVNGLKRNVVLAGWQSNAEVRKALTEARALVLPSFAEGLPIVIMESLALGRPVVSTKITGIPELVDDSCGWLVEPGDVPALTEALKTLLATPPDRLTEMAAVGRARVQARHDQDHNAAALRALIDEVAAAG